MQRVWGLCPSSRALHQRPLSVVLRCELPPRNTMINPHLLYDDVVATRLLAMGKFVAWRGKLAHGDSRTAYVTHNGKPVASFWHEIEAIRYVREKAA